MPSTAPVLDLERLLTPIEGENPAGEDLSYSGILTEIKELRRADDDASFGEWEPKDRKTADWPKALRLATETLATKTKDIRVVGYVTECATKIHGLAGLRDGLKLLREVQERFWDNLYPLIEDGDCEIRVGTVELFDSLLPMRIREHKVTKSMTSGAAYTQLDWEDSKRVDEWQRAATTEATAAAEQALADGKIAGETFRKAVASTPKSQLERWAADLDEAWEALGLVNQTIEQKFGDAGADDLPVLSKIKSTLETTRNLCSEIEKVVGPLRAVEMDAGGSEAAEESYDAGGGSGGGMGMGMGAAAFSGPGISPDPQDREDALRRLNSVANYFRKHEPHSPVAYLVDRAVTWGQMPLEKWLEEVVKDTTTLGNIRELLWIKAPDGY